ncbi:hypothetical protein RSOLAG1IB_09802 [Rhizoctonia solani AG-1 IB]|uniref:BTB domain-containing protein n=1 Tax=Thanatephorus cucumeris (strain AG1-IB / isolate 7/3/14) TaxID=1108050 RepID=A0A0B7FTY5_THACB|nr:hypothetical protein RSOLAG1IB_09802 [Rhizoctonia solani AG-1 IB]
MEYEPKYTVVLRGQEFLLTKSQIDFDSPNYFSTCFLGDFREAETRRLELSRNPDLFRLIVEYLCGYEILPLNEKSLPPFMSLETGIQNLRADALFYQLDGLVNVCDRFVKPRENIESLRRSFMILGYSASSTYILDETAPKGISVDNIKWLEPQKDSWITVVKKETIDEMGALQSPRSFNDFQGLRIVSAMEEFTKKALGNYHKHGWKLKGWRMEVVLQGTRPKSTEILIVLEDVRTRSK